MQAWGMLSSHTLYNSTAESNLPPQLSPLRLYLEWLIQGALGLGQGCSLTLELLILTGSHKPFKMTNFMPNLNGQ